MAITKITNYRAIPKGSQETSEYFKFHCLNLLNLLDLHGKTRQDLERLWEILGDFERTGGDLKRQNIGLTGVKKTPNIFHLIIACISDGQSILASDVPKEETNYIVEVLIMCLYFL